MTPAEPVAQRLRMFTRESDGLPIEWSWVREQLERAATYWVVARAPNHPHPRPVWGVWHDDRFHLSIGSPIVRAQLDDDQRVTVHLDSGLDVVIVEGEVTGASDADDDIARYDTKYDWQYDAATYGPLTEITAQTVMAWRAAGPAGRDGFHETGRWTLR